MFDDGFVDEVVGMDLVDNGFMQYEEGVILTEMGMPGLGMAEMQLGQMQMAQGATLMEVGMMGNNMGFGVGYGIGPGVYAAQQALLLADTAYICMGLGCTYPCCTRRCLPGCVLSCCQNKVVVASNQQSSKPVIVSPFAQKQIVPFQQQFQPIFHGDLYSKHLLSWNFIKNGCVTLTHFLNEQIGSITKIKIKREILHNDCQFLKTTTFHTNDHYFAVPKYDQIHWFCAIIWAKLQLQKYNCQLQQDYCGFVEGNILRKSKFLGEWAFRHVVIDMQGLSSFVNRNEPPTTRIKRIPQLWTRFDLIDQNMYLVIKLHFEGSKYEYGIPLGSAILWIKAFASLMR